MNHAATHRQLAAALCYVTRDTWHATRDTRHVTVVLTLTRVRGSGRSSPRSDRSTQTCVSESPSWSCAECDPRRWSSSHPVHTNIKIVHQCTLQWLTTLYIKFKVPQMRSTYIARCRRSRSVSLFPVRVSSPVPQTTSPATATVTFKQTHATLNSEHTSFS